MNEPGVSFFISDAHLGVKCPGGDAREEYLIQFLRSIRGSAANLFIVGDLFDFWIEYRHAIRPCYFPVLHEMMSLVESGVAVHYLAGNHDFALGPFLRDTIGMKIYPSGFGVTVQGRRIFLHHGDGLIKSDIGYRLLGRILRSPVNQFLYRMLHPDTGVALASFFSRSSRFVTGRSRREKTKAAYRAVARKHLLAGNDLVVFGHTHWAELVADDTGTYCNTGEWMRKFNYAKLENGEMSLWEYGPEGSSHMSCSEKHGASIS